ncbi:MAG: PEP-CTERM sorting domain-containing protein [candidate division Zixibacteria bacterium]|nr:PEP-CTERM sorting domain-containing protein [candidate division Zixibacteria bacterium]
MKKYLILMAIMMLSALSIGAGNAEALIYHGADITMMGRQYSDISSTSTWWVLGTEIATPFSNQHGPEYGWIEYETYLTAGNWNVGLNVSNWGYIGDGSEYDGFLVANSFNGQTMRIEANETEINNGYFNIDIEEDGYYSFRYSWLNDYYNTDGEIPVDANIRINSVFFDDTSTDPVPEPATMLLMGTGILGMGLVRRLRRK